MTELRFDHRIILVVLSNNSFGHQICLELLSKGAKLIVFSSSPVDFPCIFASNLSDLNACLSKFTKIDVFINCNTDQPGLSLESTN